MLKNLTSKITYGIRQIEEEIEKLRRKLEKARKEKIELSPELLNDPVIFAKQLLGFTPTFYQEKLLRDMSKRIVVRMSRQAGKTTTIAVKAIWFAVTHPKTLTLIIAPSKRQSMIMMDRIQGFLMSLPSSLRRKLVYKMLRTVIYFKNGSQIVALPCSVHLLRGYTAHMILADEAAFFRDDETIFYSVLYPMLSTTDGWLIVSSTPWGKNSVFYRMNQDPNFSKHVVTWRDVVKSGLIKKEFIDEMRKQLPVERFKMEFEAEFIEDEDAWLKQDLLAKAIDPDLEYVSFESQAKGTFYMGIDFGKHQDYSVITVVRKDNDEILRVVHVKRFPLETAYAAVIGYAKTLSERWKHIVKIYADVTGVGDYIVEDMKRAGLNVEGIYFTTRVKEEMANYMKSLFEQGKLKIPYDPELLAELNVEKFELTKDGHIKFYHPQGTHDDRFWSLALAVYASKEEGAAIVRIKKVV